MKRKKTEAAPKVSAEYVLHNRPAIKSLREAAFRLSHDREMNENWRITFARLAVDLDHLDAMIARAELDGGGKVTWPPLEAKYTSFSVDGKQVWPRKTK